MSPTALVRHLRGAATPARARPAWAAGLRAAVATVTPLLIGHALHLPEISWASLAGFQVSLADKGGAYRARATTMGAVVLAVAFSVAVAAVAGRTMWVAVPLMLLWGVACGMARAYGAGAVSVGIAAAVGFMISLATPATAAIGGERAGMVALGGIWAMLLALLLWPLRPYRPAEHQVARCYTLLADYAAAIRELLLGGKEDAWRALFQAEPARIREAIDTARSTLGWVRRGRAGETGRGERLLVLVEAADQTFAYLLALTDVLEQLSGAAGRPHLPHAEHELAEFERAARGVAAVTLEARSPAPPPYAAPEAAPLAAPLAGVLPPAAAHQLAELLGNLREYVEVAEETAHGGGNGGAAAWPALAMAPRERRRRMRRALLPIRENLTLRSVVFRHALRVGVATAVAVLVTYLLDVERGYWITLTVLVVLQPYTGATVRKGVQRIGGTVLGGILTALLAAAIHDPRGITALVFVFATLSVALLPINYGAYALLMTPTFVLLAEVSTGEWNLYELRMLHTLLGGAIALVGAGLLWPIPERRRLPGEVAGALRANREYLRLAVRLVEAREHAGEPFDQARRRTGLANRNAEASLQRLIEEAPAGERQLEPLMTVLVYLRRFSASITALALVPWTEEPGVSRDFFAQMGEALGSLADAAETGRKPPPLPAGVRDPVPASTPLSAQAERVRRQLAVLHGGITRWLGADGEDSDEDRPATSSRPGRSERGDESPEARNPGMPGRVERLIWRDGRGA